MPLDAPGQTRLHLPDAVLARLNRATTLADLLPVLVHDLNNALLVIAGSVELLEDGGLTEPQAVRVGRIRGQQEKMAATLRALVAVLRPGADDGDRAELGAVVRQAVELRRSASTRRRIHVRVDGPPAAIVVGLDAGSLLQIVLNLLANAEAAVSETTASERGIVLSLGRDERDAVLRVADTGPGLDAGQTGGLFEPFVSGTPGTTAGLGLAVSRQIAEGAGGTLASLATGTSGACLELRIPLA